MLRGRKRRDKNGKRTTAGYVGSAANGRGLLSKFTWGDFFSLSQFRLFCRHPSSNERLEKRIEVHIDTTLSETVAMAHKV